MPTPQELESHVVNTAPTRAESCAGGHDVWLHKLGPTGHTSAPHLFGISAPVYPQLLLSQYHCGDVEVLIWFYLKKKLFGVKLKVWQVQENPAQLVLWGHCLPVPFSQFFSSRQDNYLPTLTGFPFPPSSPGPYHPSAHCAEGPLSRGGWRDAQNDSLWQFLRRTEVGSVTTLPICCEIISSLGQNLRWEVGSGSHGIPESCQCQGTDHPMSAAWWSTTSCLCLLCVGRGNLCLGYPLPIFWTRTATRHWTITWIATNVIWTLILEGTWKSLSTFLVKYCTSVWCRTWP